MGRGIALTNEQRDFILNTYQIHKNDKNYSIEKLAEFCHVSRTTYEAILKADNIVSKRDFVSVLEIVDKKVKIPSEDTLLWASKRHGWEYDDLIKTARQETQLKSSPALVESTQLTQTNNIAISLEEISRKLDSIAGLILREITAIENATQTIPQNININTTEELSSLCKKIDTGAISVKIKGIK